MSRKILGLIALVAMVGLLGAACAGDEGAQGPKGDTGDTGAQGAAGSAPSDSELQALIDQALAGTPATAASLANGGLLYDKWWKAAGVDEPTGDHALWALQDTNTRSGSTTYRCKECHGWDYKGIGGWYSSGSHKTGFPGVYQAGATLSKDELVGVLQGSTDYRHDFSAMGADNLADLAVFLSEGLLNDTLYINYATRATIGADVANGQTLYDATCAMCHGADGKQIDFHDGEGVGGVARDNPWETLHKIRAGQPATSMPSSIINGWSLQDALDVMGYSATLGAQ